MCDYIVTIEADDEDVVRRIELINSVMFRILKTSKLKEVIETNYRKGRMRLQVYGPPDNPYLMSGLVRINVEEV